MTRHPASGHGFLPQLSLLRQRLLQVPTAVILLWLITLWWGERYVFSSSVERCRWEHWESWGSQSQPHHVLLVADPQLVDPHTYPDRPWPLSSLTIFYTDRYLRRAYRQLQASLYPDSTIFLGDLFDGGREWATAETESPVEEFKKYDESYWLQEYTRFSRLFLQDWSFGSLASRAAPMGRRVIASLPGNHDLGFASGIQQAVKDRFDAHFGPLNRIDIIGNHSIVSLDTVSLSAMDQIDPKTGSSGNGDGSASSAANSHLWKPTEDFLIDAKNVRHRAVQREWQRMHGRLSTRPVTQFPAQINQLETASKPLNVRSQENTISTSQFPSIVLSHVPLFRSRDTSCGPMRERGIAIPLSAGYQYQNALTPLISSDIVKHLNAEEINMIYSGDDHDYCEIEHGEFTGRIKEITVKSMSWAMGIRRPGVQLASLWNPIDVTNPPANNAATPKHTIQNHLCLLPDQLGIFIRYAQVLGLSLIILAIAAFRFNPNFYTYTNHDRSQPLLPVTNKQQPSSASSSDSDHKPFHLKTRSTTKLGGYGNLPASSRSASPVKAQRLTPDPFAPASNGYLVDAATNVRKDDDDEHDWANSRSRRKSSYMPYTRYDRLGIFVHSLRNVAFVVLLFYGYLLWTG